MVFPNINRDSDNYILKLEQYIERLIAQNSELKDLIDELEIFKRTRNFVESKK